MPKLRVCFIVLALLSILSRPSSCVRAADDVAVGPTLASDPSARIKAPPGFQVDLIYTVPKATQGSWVNMTIDAKGRIITSDQNGKLYRVTVPSDTQSKEGVVVEPIDVAIGESHGLLWAFDSLYVVVNRVRQYNSGLYRVRDTDGDDKLDSVELLRRLEGSGEHGPHAVILAPDGQSLYVVAGNATRLPDLAGSQVPRIWGEDSLLPYMPDASGFMTSERAPGGFICRVSPDGKDWNLMAMGFRNSFDIAFNSDGELFTYDSDMEWDVNTPWYRPTRVLHVTGGADFGYRNGSGKWPPYYIDSLPAVTDVGPGSPTGITFGYGAKFPEKYRQALFLSDWSYGKMYALHLKPQNSSYTGELEEFLAGTPLPLTDVVVSQRDGAMYFLVGGRATQSGLYRVTYTGPMTSVALPVDAGAVQARAMRHRLETWNGSTDATSLDEPWEKLGHPDRFIRWAARIAIEKQPQAIWRQRALAPNAMVQSSLQGLLALTHVSAKDSFHRESTDSMSDTSLRNEILSALDRISWQGLTHSERLDYLRTYEVVLNRFGQLDDETRFRLAKKFEPLLPASSHQLNIELAQILVFLQSPESTAKIVGLLEQAPTQEEQIDYARNLRFQKAGWTLPLQERYFAWFPRSDQYSGGNSFRGFIARIKKDAVENLTDDEKQTLGPILERKGTATAIDTSPARSVVKSWTVDELLPEIQSGLAKRNFDRGRSMMAVGKCFACHRFANEGGGLGPDLSAIAGRFNTRDLLESIVLPSKTISDQYQTIIIVTSAGQTVTGRIVNLRNNSLSISTDMLNPNKMTNVNRNEIESMKPSPVSIMPEGLLNTLERDEILDLFAYLLSRGDRDHAFFQ